MHIKLATDNTPHGTRTGKSDPSCVNTMLQFNIFIIESMLLHSFDFDRRIYDEKNLKRNSYETLHSFALGATNGSVMTKTYMSYNNSDEILVSFNSQFSLYPATGMN